MLFDIKPVMDFLVSLFAGDEVRFRGLSAHLSTEFRTITHEMYPDLDM